jgi:GntR family transcriptional regulator
MNDRRNRLFAFSLDFSQPLYEQVIAQMRQVIVRGEIGLGEKIPSVRELAQLLKINPNTVMRAYQELEREGLTEKRRGQGTFITSSFERVQAVRQSFAEQYMAEFVSNMKNLGFQWNEIRSSLQQYWQEQKGENRE